MTQTSRQSIDVAGMRVDVVTMAEAVARVAELLDRDGPSLVVTPNLDHLVRHRQSARFRELYNQAFLVCADGAPIVWLSALLPDSPTLPGRVTGVDLLWEVLKEHGRETGLFIIGSSELACAAFTDRVHAELGAIPVVSTSSDVAYLTDSEVTELARRIEATDARLIALALGSPKQEEFFIRLRPHLSHGVCIGCGAAIDLLGGTYRRAPRLMQERGLEWAFRLMQEPRRLWRRYLTNGMHFLPLLVRQGLSRGSTCVRRRSAEPRSARVHRR